MAQPHVLVKSFYKAWRESPDLNTQQLTHAVEPGKRIAVCGVATAAQSGPWPRDATAWDLPLGRCPICAQVVYGTLPDGE